MLTFEINALITSLLCWEVKQGIKSKAGEGKCNKETKIAALPNEWRDILLNRV